MKSTAQSESANKVPSADVSTIDYKGITVPNDESESASGAKFAKSVIWGIALSIPFWVVVFLAYKRFVK